MKVSAQLGVNTYTEEGNDYGKYSSRVKVKMLFNIIKFLLLLYLGLSDFNYIKITKRMMKSTHHSLRASSSYWWIDIITISTNE